MLFIIKLSCVTMTHGHLFSLSTLNRIQVTNQGIGQYHEKVLPEEVLVDAFS